MATTTPSTAKREQTPQQGSLFARTALPPQLPVFKPSEQAEEYYFTPHLSTALH